MYKSDYMSDGFMLTLKVFADLRIQFAITIS